MTASGHPVRVNDAPQGDTQAPHGPTRRPRERTPLYTPRPHGATGNHETDNRVIPAKGFTFSNMRLPVGAVGPEHTHNDVEEAFFVLEGEVEVTVHDAEDGTKTASRVLGYRDLIVVPAGVPRSLRNIGTEDALFCVIIGTQKPQLPTYPKTSEMYGITRD